MKYLIIAALLLAGCANVNRHDEFDEFDEMAEAKPASEELVEIKDVETDIAAAEPLELEPIKPSNAKAFYAIQIGAYPTKKLAKMKAAKIGVDRSLVSFQEADVNGKTWQRVYLGKFRNKKAATEFQKKWPGDSLIRNIQSQDASLWH